MLRARCLMCAVEKAHSSLPPIQSILSIFCPGTQHCAGPMCHAVTVGWMVQRGSNLQSSPRSSQNLLFWKHLRGEVSILEVTVAQNTPFPFHSLGKACSPLISIRWGAFSPHLNPSSFILCHYLSPISYEHTFSCLLSVFRYQKKQKSGRGAQKLQSHFSDFLEKLLSIFNRPRVPGSSLAHGDGGCSPIYPTDLPWDWLEGLTERGIYCRAWKQKCTSQVLPLWVMIRKEPAPPKPLS